MKYPILLLFLTLNLLCFAQIRVAGTIKEAKSGIPMMAATVALTPQNQTGSKPFYTTSDEDGYFELQKIPEGAYILKITFVGFEDYVKKYNQLPKGGKLGSFYMKEQSILLEEAVAQGRATRATQKGDTLSYNASAFKTAQGSNTEDLITKMPGIMVEGGKVEAQGEEIKRIFVDGKQFFEGDPMLALRNLPADLVESIEVFDKQSDDAQFAGFDDGNTQKSINIRTRNPNKAKQFGKASAGMGTDWKYQLNGNYNYFQGNRRISVLAMSNNVNQQNFSQEDIAGVMSSNSRKVSKRGSSQTMLGQIPGVTNTTAFGINYSDKWGEKVDVQSSYFFNLSDNKVTSNTYRSYYDTIPYARNYSEEYTGHSTNMNHRFNMKLNYNINQRNAIMFQPSLSFQDNKTSSMKEGSTMRDGAPQNETSIQTNNHSQAYNLRGTLQYRHRFEKPGRMISVSVTGSKHQNTAENDYHSMTKYISNSTRIDTVMRRKDNVKNQYKLSGMINYNEPLTKKTFLNVNYRVNYNKNDANNRTYDLDRNEQILVEMLDTALTNIFESDYVTQVGAVGLRHYNKDKGISLYGSVNFEHASLQSEQVFPLPLHTDKNFFSVLPFVRMDYKINKENSIRMMLRSSSKEPSISQLQNQINDNNPLMVSGGNPNLDQESQYMFSTRYSYTPKSGYTFFFMVGGNYTNNYIGNNTRLIQEAEEVSPGIILQEGAQFTTPVNLNGAWGGNALVTLGMPIDWIKSNINFTTSFRYNKLPGVYNNQDQVTEDIGVTPGIVLSSNISDKLDFTLSYYARLNFFENNLVGSSNNSFINQTAGAKVNWEFWKGFTFETNVAYENYRGMTDGYNHAYVMLNAALGKRFLRSKRLEVKLSAHDILNQNSSIRRQITNSYYQDVTSNVLQPYMMLTMVYDLRLFPQGKGKGKGKGPHGGGGRGPRGMGGHGFDAL